MDMDIDFTHADVEEIHIDTMENLVSKLDGSEEFQAEIDDIAVGLYQLCS